MFEVLECRRVFALPDLIMEEGYSDGFTNLIVEYSIVGAAMTPFRFGVYRSTDLSFGGDVLVDTINVAHPSLLGVGPHQVLIPIGTGATQIALPGAGAVDSLTDYRLLLVADDNNAVAESDADPFNEDNMTSFVGAYHLPSGKLFVHGTESGDTAAITPSGGNLVLTANALPQPIPYVTTDVSAIRIWGHDGNDVLNVTGVPKPIVIFGGTGNDVASGGSANDTIFGGLGSDTYRFDDDLPQGSDLLSELGGDADTIEFSQTTGKSIVLNLSLSTVQVLNINHSLQLAASALFENITGGSLADTLTGNGRNNRLNGNAGNDTLSGVTGGDTFIGGPGNDTLIGGSGDDTFQFDTDLSLGTDTLNESGGGKDTLDFSLTTTRSVAINLGIAAAQVVNAGLTLVLSSAVTFEKVIGGALGDTITGNALNNILLGGAGNDVMFGRNGRDLIIGGLGVDTLNGESGDDLLIAGRTSQDANPTALRMILAEWVSTTNDYNTRVAILRAGGSGVRLKAAAPGATVFNDSPSVDQLTGGLNDDWFFAALADTITDQTGGELRDTLP